MPSKYMYQQRKRDHRAAEDAELDTKRPEVTLA